MAASSPSARQPGVPRQLEFGTGIPLNTLSSSSEVENSAETKQSRESSSMDRIQLAANYETVAKEIETMEEKIKQVEAAIEKATSEGELAYLRSKALNLQDRLKVLQVEKCTILQAQLGTWIFKKLNLNYICLIKRHVPGFRELNTAVKCLAFLHENNWIPEEILPAMNVRKVVLVLVGIIF